MTIYHWRAITLRCLVLMLSAAGFAGCASLGNAPQRAVIRAKDKVVPALVHIRPVKEVFRRGERREVVVTGSGFIISPDGYVVTNEHVAGESNFVRCVLYNKEELEAEVVGVDPFTDIAVLKLQREKSETFPYVALGTSADLEAGETVMALGSPHGLERSVSMGIVSVTDRYLGDVGDMVSPYNTWIQTDAAINPGNSGGPLVNLKGAVVGVNARRLNRADNVGFAIPIDIAKDVIDQIIANGRVTRSWIGITLQEMTQRTEDPTQPGVVIADVDPLSPANEAQIRPGDVLLAVDGAPVNARFVEDLPPIRRLLARKPVGSQVTLTINRADEILEIATTTEEKGALRGDEIELEEWGFTVSELTPGIIRRARLTSRQGVYVSGEQAGGIAANAGLQRGDIILAVDNEPVENLAEFVRIYNALTESRKRLVLLDVKRGALTRFVLVKQNESAVEVDAA